MGFQLPGKKRCIAVHIEENVFRSKLWESLNGKKGMNKCVHRIDGKARDEDDEAKGRPSSHHRAPACTRTKPLHTSKADAVSEQRSTAEFVKVHGESLFLNKGSLLSTAEFVKVHNESVGCWTFKPRFRYLEHLAKIEDEMQRLKGELRDH
eukprot:1158630-Pelagomonas_calceolata.AAC.1